MPEAEQVYQSALKANPDYAPIHHALGFLYYQAGRLDVSRESLSRSVQLRPRSADAWNDFGNTLRDLGELEQAVEAFRRAVKLAPDFALAHCALAQLRDHSEPDAHDSEFIALQQAYARSRSGSAERRDLAWGLARAMEQRGECEKTLSLLREAHRLTRGRGTFDLAGTARYLEAIREVFTEEFIASRSALGSASELPIYVFGLPRSGTSLVEQVLASHSDVFGAGELRLIGSLCGQLEQRSGRNFAAAFAALDDAAIKRVAQDVQTQLQRVSLRSRRIVDKMPANFLCLGMLAILLPRARFIHCRRDPLATCWSIYSTRFAEPHGFAHDLADLGGYYRLYQQHMEHWQKVMPGRIHTVSYEQLVQHPVQQIAILVEAAGLTMEPACLEFHNTRRQVRTASAQQVRRPIYTEALDRTSDFDAWLAPLREALGEVL